VDDIGWLVARRAEALHHDLDEAATSPGRPSSTTGAGGISASNIRTSSHRADKALEPSFRPQRVAAAVALERSFTPQRTAAALMLERTLDTRRMLERTFGSRKLLLQSFDARKVMANLFSAYRAGPVFDSGMIRVGPEPASASPLVPTSPHGPIPSPADPGWLHQLLNDEKRFRAVAPYLMLTSGGCTFLGLFLLALADPDPAVRVALEILDAEASIGSLIVTVMVLLASQRK
jgi:hypothetical protein